MNLKSSILLAAAALMFITSSCCNNESNNQLQADMTPSETPVIDAIMARRSIRQYKDTPVPREMLRKIAECGINAPNAMNHQEWEVRIIDNPEKMQLVQDLMVAGNPDLQPEMLRSCMRGAPVMTFIARDLNYDFSAYDCGLLAGNMMLAAQSLGVGSICLGSPVRFINDAHNSADILALLGFSENYQLCLCVGFGYANETPDAKPRDINKVKYID
jgi:nitroreductase